jgi:hypothetical protein
MGTPDITRVLTSLAVDRKVASSTQNQALSALLFLYRESSSKTCPGSRTSSARDARSGCPSSSPGTRCAPC